MVSLHFSLWYGLGTNKNNEKMANSPTVIRPLRYKDSLQRSGNIIDDRIVLYPNTDLARLLVYQMRNGGDI